MTIVIVDYESIVIAVRSIVGNDASTFIDINSIISSNSISNDSFSLVESNSFVNVIDSSDSATILEKGAFSSEDIAQDNGTATDFTTLISADESTTDTLNLSDLSSINANLISYEIGVPISSVLFPSGTVYPSESVYPVAPNFAFTDSISGQVTAITSDSFTATEVSSSLNNANSSDSLSLSENIKIEIDSGTTPIQGTDSANLFEENTIFVAGNLSDSINIDENNNIDVDLSSSDSSYTLSEISNYIAPVVSSDSFVITESNSITISETSTDSGSLSENRNISANFLATDNAYTLSESNFISVSASSEENIISLSESSNQINLTNVPDSILLTELSSLANAIASSDNTTFFDKNDGVFLSSIDLSSLQEFINSINVDYRYESILLSEQNSVAVTISSTDNTYQLSETTSFSAQDIAQDAISLTDQSSISANVSSTGDNLSLTENKSIQLSSNDSANLTESNINIFISSSDQANVVETSSLTVAIVSAETINIAENRNISAILATSDSGSVNDRSSLQNALSSNDSGVAADQTNLINIGFASKDSISLSEFISSFSSVTNSKDSSSLTEKGEASIVSSDALIFSELASNSANISSNQTASLLEIINNISLPVVDRLSFGEFNKTIGNSSRDSFSLLGEFSIIYDARFASDYISFNEVPLPTVGLNVLQLISFTEGKIGLRVAAPLIFNVNGTATIHGTVTGGSVGLNINNGSATIHGTATGNPVIIALSGGTTPILL